jgi:hypothetical protein
MGRNCENDPTWERIIWEEPTPEPEAKEEPKSAPVA